VIVQPLEFARIGPDLCLIQIDAEQARHISTGATPGREKAGGDEAVSCVCCGGDVADSGLQSRPQRGVR
jgi:hypothetical protein